MFDGGNTVQGARLMEIRFREFDPFNCWIWLRFNHAPGQGERGYVETVFDSWFFLGKLGGFNAENLQVQDEGADLSGMTYDTDTAAAVKSFLTVSANDGQGGLSPAGYIPLPEAFKQRLLTAVGAIQ